MPKYSLPKGRTDTLETTFLFANFPCHVHHPRGSQSTWLLWPEYLQQTGSPPQNHSTSFYDYYLNNPIWLSAMRMWVFLAVLRSEAGRWLLNSDICLQRCLVQPFCCSRRAVGCLSSFQAAGAPLKPWSAHLANLSQLGDAPWTKSTSLHRFSACWCCHLDELNISPLVCNKMKSLLYLYKGRSKVKVAAQGRDQNVQITRCNLPCN